jgi:geranylgeranyl diphosphate synthase type I
MIDEPSPQAAAVSLDAFHHVWPRAFPIDEVRALLGPAADALIAEVLERQVTAPVWSLVDRGGKRWRTAIGRLAYRVAGGGEPAPEAVFEVPELLHNASLVIDDIEDVATERRGGPPAHLRYGLPVALNAANAAYFRALAVLRGHLADAPRLRALDMLSEELFVAHLGQALDLTLGAYLKLGVELRTAHYETIARAKTGALVRISARLGAIAACASDEVEQALATWAGELGVAYQIRDDLEDLKLGTGDLERGSLTHPLLVALEQDASARALVLQRLASGAEADGCDARLAALLESPSVAARCRQDAEASGARAAAALARLQDGPSRDALLALTEQLAGRAAAEGQ